MVRPSSDENNTVIALAANLLAFGFMAGMVRSFKNGIYAEGKGGIWPSVLSRQEVLGRIRILSLKIPLEEAIKMFEPIPGGTLSEKEIAEIERWVEKNRSVQGPQSHEDRIWERVKLQEGKAKESSATYGDLIGKNKKLLLENAEKFRRTFGVALHKFMSPLVGFDIVRFDEFLGTPEGISTRDYINRKYGIKAVELIEKLIK